MPPGRHAEAAAEAAPSLRRGNSGGEDAGAVTLLERDGPAPAADDSRKCGKRRHMQLRLNAYRMSIYTILRRNFHDNP